MAIPSYQECMSPILQLASKQDECVFSEVIEEVAKQFDLTDEERNELLPSGKYPTFDNRVSWAITFMSKAHLLERTARGRFKITARGREVFKSTPSGVNTKFLKQFQEFQEFQKATRADSNKEEAETGISESTPYETLETGYLDLRRALAQELLDRIKQCSPKFFEKLVVDLLVAIGYGGSRRDAGQAVGRCGDEGIDGIIKEDKLGLDVVYIQAKRWKDAVGRPTVQEFAGSLEGHRARKGVLITTSRFSQEAKDYVGKIEKKIVLIDGEELTQLMMDHGVGVAEVVSYSVNRIDSDYFEEES